MEDVLFQAVVHGASAVPGELSDYWRFWRWVFWVGCLVGVIGGIVLFFKKPVEGI